MRGFILVPITALDGEVRAMGMFIRERTKKENVIILAISEGQTLKEFYVAVGGLEDCLRAANVAYCGLTSFLNEVLEQKAKRSAQRCDRCGLPAEPLAYDPITKKRLCVLCERAIRIKRGIHGLPVKTPKGLE